MNSVVIDIPRGSPLTHTDTPSKAKELELHPYALCDYEQNVAYNTKWSRLYLAASAIAAVAYLVLAAGIFALTAISAPLHLPLVGVGILLGIHPSLVLATSLQKKSYDYKQEAHLNKELLECQQLIKDEEITSQLTSLGISPATPQTEEEIKRAKTLLARYNYTLSQIEKALKEADQAYPSQEALDKNQEVVLTKADGTEATVNPLDFSPNTINLFSKEHLEIANILYGRRKVREVYLNFATRQKIESARILTLLQDPSMRELALQKKSTVIPLKVQKASLLLGDCQGEPATLRVGENSYTRSQVLEKNTLQLAKEIQAVQV